MESICPICGYVGHPENIYGHAVYPEVCNYDICPNCGFITGGEDNSAWQNWEERSGLENVRSMNKIWAALEDSVL